MDVHLLLSNNSTTELRFRAIPFTLKLALRNIDYIDYTGYLYHV